MKMAFKSIRNIQRKTFEDQCKQTNNDNTNHYYFRVVSPDHILSIDAFKCLFDKPSSKPDTFPSSKSNNNISRTQQQSLTTYHNHTSLNTQTYQNTKSNTKTKQLPMNSINMISYQLYYTKPKNKTQFKYERYLNQYVEPEKVQLKKQLLIDTLRRSGQTSARNTARGNKPCPFTLKPKERHKDSQFSESALSLSPGTRFQYVYTNPSCNTQTNYRVSRTNKTEGNC